MEQLRKYKSNFAFFIRFRVDDACMHVYRMEILKRCPLLTTRSATNKGTKYYVVVWDSAATIFFHLCFSTAINGVNKFTPRISRRFRWTVRGKRKKKEEEKLNVQWNIGSCLIWKRYRTHWSRIYENVDDYPSHLFTLRFLTINNWTCLDLIFFSVKYIMRRWLTLLKARYIYEEGI